MDEVHTTRRKLYEATKDMTVSERTAYFNQQATTIAEQHGFKIVTSTNSTRTQPKRA